MIPIDFESPKFRAALRFFLYGVAGAVAIVVTVLLVFVAQGYDFDRKTGQVIQNGLVLINNTPEDAGIFIDGKFDNDNTPGKLPLPAGDYRLTLRRDGYREWNRDISLEGSEVLWMYYPKLFPETITPTPLRAFDNAVENRQSPDKKWVFVQTSPTSPVFHLIDLDTTDTLDQVVTLPADILSVLPTGGFGVFSLVEWGQDSKELLIQHDLGGVKEYLLLDIEQPETARNLTRDFGLNFEQPHLNASKQNEMFAVIDGGLRFFDLKSLNVAAPVLEDIVYYEIKGDKTIAVVQSSGQNSVKVGLIRDDKPIFLGDLPKQDEYLIGFETFDSNEYFSFSNQDSGITKIYQNPFDDKSGPALPFRVIEQPGIQQMLFSPNSQFIMTQSGQNFSVYDLDQDEFYTFKIEDDLGPNTVAEWMDGHRLQVYDSNNHVIVFEFDGENRQDIGVTLPHLGATFDRAAENMYTYTISSSGEKIQFLQSSLVADIAETN